MIQARLLISAARLLVSKELADRYNPLGSTPVFVFIDLAGRAVVRYIGASSGVEEFLWLGEYVVNREYRHVHFSRYKRIKKKN